MPRVGDAAITNPTTNHYQFGSYASESTVASEGIAMPADGWVTELAVYGRGDNGTGGAGSSTASVIGYVNDKQVGRRSATWTSSFDWRVLTPAYIGSDNRATKGQKVRYAASCNTRAGAQVGGGTYDMVWDNADTPNTFTENGKVAGGYSMRGYFDYVRQEAPTTGVFSSPAAGEAINQATVTVAGSTPHGNGDGAHDYTTKVQVQVFEAPAGAPVGAAVKDETFDTTTAQQNAKTFSRTISGLASGKQYVVHYRHYDSWNVSSPFTGYRAFVIAGVPDTPEPVAPMGTINTLTGYAYSFVYNHPEGRAAESYEIELRNSAGTAPALWASGTRATTAGPSQTITYTPASGHPTLTPGTSYTWQARVKDSLGAWSNWSSPTAAGPFKVNAPPLAPTITKPANNELTGDLEVRAAFSDPDGDPITAADLELTRVSTGLPVDLNAGGAGTLGAMTITGGGASATFTIPTGLVTAGAQYRVRARATDGKVGGYGVYGATRTFTFVSAPTPSLTIPGETARANLVADPSFEADLAGEPAEFWNVSGAAAGNTATRETGQDAVFGSGRTRLHKAAGTADLILRSDRMAVDPTKAYRAQVWAKKEPSAGGPYLPASARFAVACYAAATGGTATATIYPASIAQLGAGGADVDIHWKNYGGYVRRVGSSTGPSPTGMPAGTTHVELLFWLGATVEQDVAIDGAMFEPVPETSSAAWPAVSAFFGYADPDLPATSPGGYGVGGAYGGTIGAWVGEPNASASGVLNVLERASSNEAQIVYTNPSGALKTHDRLTIQRLSSSGAWEAHHGGEWRASAAVQLPIPDYVFANERRYRMRVEVRDANGFEGATPYVQFVARYPGPPELAVLDYSADSANGTVTITFEPTTLAPAEFAKIEIARECAETGEKMRTVAILSDATQTSYTYHYPVSNRTYRYYVRQVQLVGPYEIAGRWRWIDASVDYSGWNFLKSAEDPENEMVAFQHTSGEGPDYPREKPNEGYVPWGATAPVHLFGEGTWRSGETAFTLWPHHEDYGYPSVAERVAMLKKMRRVSGAMALMTDKPEPEKTWIAMTGPLAVKRVGSLTGASFSWTQNAYSEDAYNILGRYDEAI